MRLSNTKQHLLMLMKNYISYFLITSIVGLLTLAPTCNKKVDKTTTGTNDSTASGKPKIDSIKLVTDKARLCGEVPMTAEQEKKFIEMRGILNDELEREVGSRDLSNIPEQISYNLKFHIVKGSSSSELKKIDGKMLQEAIKNLNRVFGQINVRFNHIGTDTLRSEKKLEDLYYNVWSPEIDAFFDKFNQPNIVNVYLLENSSDGSYLNGFTYPVDLELATGRNRDLICIGNRTLDNGKTLVHEMGHFFTLLHTFHVSGCSGCKTEERADGSNCSTTGDLICDTPADPADINFVDVRTCAYYGNLKDNRGGVYRPIINNFMSYYDACCDYKFTAQQYALIRKIAEKFRPYLKRNDTSTTPATGTTANTTPPVSQPKGSGGLTVPVTRPKPATAQRTLEQKNAEKTSATAPKTVTKPATTAAKVPAKTATAKTSTTKPATTTAKVPAKPTSTTASKPATTKTWTPSSKTPITKTPPTKPTTTSTTKK